MSPSMAQLLLTGRLVKVVLVYPASNDPVLDQSKSSGRDLREAHSERVPYITRGRPGSFKFWR